MSVFIKQLAKQFLILHRNRLLIISVVVTVAYAAMLYFIKDLPQVDKFLVLIIYNDPAIIGLFFVGLSVIMEKDQGVLLALFVTPINLHHYLLSRVLALSIIGTLCAMGMAIILSFNGTLSWTVFACGTFTTCWIFSLTGVLVVSFTTEFLHFMLRSIPFLLILSLPMLNYFELTHFVGFRIFPMDGPLQLIAASLEGNVHAAKILPLLGLATFWCLLFYLVAFRVFRQRMIKMQLT